MNKIIKRTIFKNLLDRRNQKTYLASCDGACILCECVAGFHGAYDGVFGQRGAGSNGGDGCRAARADVIHEAGGVVGGDGSDSGVSRGVRRPWLPQVRQAG